MQGLLRRRFTYANVLATAALFVALGGSSYAALRVTGANVPKDALTGTDIANLTGKDVRDNSLTGADVTLLKSADIADGELRARDFAPGELPRGPEGEPGARGPQGERGPEGARGPAGSSFDTELPSGKTLRGIYAIKYHAPFGGDFAVESVSYAAALPSRPTPHTVMHGAPPPPECPGTVAAPEAAPGHLCVYERPNFAPNRSYVMAGNTAEGRFGFVIEMGAKNAGALNSFGSWAVTAPRTP